MKKKWKKYGRKLARNIIGSSVLCYLAAIAPRLFHRPPRMKTVFYAHRGLHDSSIGAPENTLAAFQRAIEHGYGIELDLQLTKDGKVVVCHDFDLKRICGEEVMLDELTYEELSRYRVLHSEERIPLFQEVLELVDGKVPLLVELKVKNVKSMICEKADELLEQYLGEYVIESFHPKALFWYRMHRAAICRGQLSANFSKSNLHGACYVILQHLLTNFISKPDFISYDCQSKKELSLFLCRNLFGCPAYAWTIKSEAELEACKPYFDGFIFEDFLP